MNKKATSGGHSGCDIIAAKTAWQLQSKNENIAVATNTCKSKCWWLPLFCCLERSMSMEQNEEKLLMSVREACKFSGIGEAKMYALCREPDCTFVIKQGKKNLVHRAKLIAFLDTAKEI